MKMNKYAYLLLLSLSVSAIHATPRITLFFKPDLPTQAEKISQKLKKKTKKRAHHIAKEVLKAPRIEGIFVTYGGYVAASDYNGEVSFPRKHLGTTITMIITPEIVPVPLFENTILNWKRIPGVPVSMYVCQQIYDAQKDHYYWETKEINVTEDMAIPLAAITIIADPKNVRMDVGKTPTNETANFVLPNLYVTKEIDIPENSLHMLLIRHLFKPIETEENREPVKILTQIVD